jgi:1-deoxy-D-xylulose-5-phosphate reductoisomerase
MKKRIAILGSTGSIGTQALEVVGQQPEMLKVEVLAANKNVELLAKQAIEHKPSIVIIADKQNYKQLKNLLANQPVEILAGNEALDDIVAEPFVDDILMAMVGFSGLSPTINALKAGKNVALANKETMVVAGDLIISLINMYKGNIYPVDSEHSAIFQCLQGEKNHTIEKIYLTASGGPFRNKTLKELKKVTREQALKHPNWNMGEKITIDSASLMNKGLEVIEAKWFFNLANEQIEVLIHPQSIIHSIVQFNDGSMKAQMGIPDMKLPIQYALTYPNRLETTFSRLSFSDYPELTFEKPDNERFRNLKLAYHAMEKAGNMPCILNASNEIAVDAFLKGKIGFLQMTEVIEKTMNAVAHMEQPDYNCYIETDQEARKTALQFI